MSGIYVPTREGGGNDLNASPVEKSPRHASDDEILGLSVSGTKSREIKAGEGGKFEFDSPSAVLNDEATAVQTNIAEADSEKGSEAANLQSIFEANPELRKAWE